MAKIYFVVTSWSLENAAVQNGREFSPAVKSREKALKMFQDLTQREKERLKEEQPSWLEWDESCITDTEMLWEIWEDGSFDDNHIRIELVETDLQE